MATPKHPGMAENELLGASDQEEMSSAGGTVTALLPFLCDYKTSLLLHGTVYVNTQGRKHFPALLPPPKSAVWDTANCFAVEQF